MTALARTTGVRLRRDGRYLALAGVPRPRRGLATLASVLVALAAWATLAPPVLGGWTSYAITDGISMLPKFHAGDLVVLRREQAYHVGEVAAYHNLQLGEVVMHRIVAINNGHYVFKGDNNSWVDGFEPVKSQIIGAEWLHLAGVGKYVQETRDPVVAATLLGALWVASFSPRRRSRHQKRRHRHGH